MNTARTILTLSGQDRPGILDDVSSFLAERGGVIEDSQACNLHGSFAMICLVSGSADSIANIVRDLPGLAERGQMHAAARDPRGQATADTFPYRLRVTAAQQDSVVQRISHLMRVLNINIQDVRTKLKRDATPEPTGFELDLLLSIPRQTPVTMVREYLQHLCNEMRAEWTLAAL